MKEILIMLPLHSQILRPFNQSQWADRTTKIPTRRDVFVKQADIKLCLVPVEELKTNKIK
jgi:hypothetical protein